LNPPTYVAASLASAAASCPRPGESNYHLLSYGVESQQDAVLAGKRILPGKRTTTTGEKD
jgi:hypothetical protein